MSEVRDPAPNEETELLPCPFRCGRNEAPEVIDPFAGRWTVVGHKCGATGPTCRGEEDARTAWNRRASVPGWHTSDNAHNCCVHDPEIRCCDNHVPANEQHATQSGESRDFERGIESVLRIRCLKHIAVVQFNRNEAGGGECGACISEGQQRTIDELRSRNAKLEQDLEHMQSQAGADSCAAYAVRNRKLEEVLRCAEEFVNPSVDYDNYSDADTDAQREAMLRRAIDAAKGERNEET